MKALNTEYAADLRFKRWVEKSVSRMYMVERIRSKLSRHQLIAALHKLRNFNAVWRLATRCEDGEQFNGWLANCKQAKGAYA